MEKLKPIARADLRISWSRIERGLPRKITGIFAAIRNDLVTKET